MKKYKVGQILYYVVCDFDSAEIIKGVIETVEDDHIILAKDGITYWLDEWIRGKWVLDRNTYS